MACDALMEIGNVGEAVGEEEGPTFTEIEEEWRAALVGQLEDVCR